MGRLVLSYVRFTRKKWTWLPRRVFATRECVDSSLHLFSISLVFPSSSPNSQLRLSQLHPNQTNPSPNRSATTIQSLLLLFSRRPRWSPHLLCADLSFQSFAFFYVCSFVLFRFAWLEMLVLVLNPAIVVEFRDGLVGLMRFSCLTFLTAGSGNLKGLELCLWGLLWSNR